MPRYCECGCGAPLDPQSRKRFLSDAHRKRAARAGVVADVYADEVGHNPDSNGQTQDTAGPSRLAGRVRAGLETWLDDRHDLPGVIVEAARVLGDELDDAPAHSPLWGRYTALLELLTTPDREATAFNEEARALYEEFASIDVAEKWRAQKYREAEAAGEDPSRWSRLVPVGCLKGRHRWHQWPAGPRRMCLDCRGEASADGLEIAWAD